MSDRIEPIRKPLGQLYFKLALVRDYASGGANQGVQTKHTVNKAVTHATANMPQHPGQDPGSGTPGGTGTGSGATGSGATSGHPTGTVPGPTGAPPPMTAPGSVTSPSGRPPRNRGRGKRGP